MDTQDTVPTIVRRLEQDFVSGTGTLMSDYVRTDLYTDINTIYAYLASKHVSGEKDSLGREKPFFNIVLAARNVWFRATDIDRKDIILTPTKEKDIVGAFLLSVHLQDWMRKENFGKFLNTWGLELAGFNSAVTKYIEKDGRLIPSVIPWSSLIVDQVNFAENLKIEILQLTEAQLYARGYDKEAIESMCDAAKARETTKKQKKDNKNSYFKIYEVHGKLPLSYLTDKDKDDDVFVQQMHIISYMASTTKGEYDEFTLYKGREEKDPYMLTSLLPTTDGSISLDGSVKNLFDAQWMVNHTAKAIKDQLDLASKLIFQTADGNFVGQNALFAIESGDILVHELNKPLTQVNNNSHDITSLQNFGGQWKQLSAEINGISDAMLGVAPKAGSAWRQTEALLQESHSLFEIMTENKGLALEEMLRTYIIPFLMKKMNNSKEVTATLDLHGIKQIEKKYVKNKAIINSNKQIIDTVLKGEIATQPDMAQMQADVQGQLNEQGNKRFFAPSEMKTWKDEFKGLETDIEIEITGEQQDKQAMFATLNTALVAVTNPNFANNPKAQFIVDKILTATGHVSPVELSSIAELQQATQQSVPSGGKVASDLPVDNLIAKQ
jgi:hypothetical protein